MKTQGYHTYIEVSSDPDTVFHCITEVSKWWNRSDFEGSSKKLNDEFSIHHPGQHYSKKRLVELVPGKKIVWLITDSTLNWLKGDQHEWTNTRLVFEITAKDEQTVVIHFTHEGLTPEKECYDLCTGGWNMVIRERLFNFITTGQETSS